MEGVAEVEVGELGGVDRYLARLALVGLDRDAVPVAIGVEDRARDPVLDPPLAGDGELGGEDHLVAGAQAIGLAGQLDRMRAELACLRHGAPEPSR